MKNIFPWNSKGQLKNKIRIPVIPRIRFAMIVIDEWPAHAIAERPSEKNRGVFIDTEIRFRTVHSRFPETSLEIKAYTFYCVCVRVHNSENSRASVVESMKGWSHRSVNHPTSWINLVTCNSSVSYPLPQFTGATCFWHLGSNLIKQVSRNVLNVVFPLCL